MDAKTAAIVVVISAGVTLAILAYGLRHRIPYVDPLSDEAQSSHS